MIPLSETQSLILSRAAARPGNLALPLPDSLRGGAAAKVVEALDDLRARAPSLDPAAFKTAYEDMLTSIQHDL